MTKYVLHGGGANLPLKGNNLFYREIISSLSEPVKLLLIYYSREDQELPRLLEEDRENFSLKLLVKNVELNVASPDPSVFREQLMNTDAVYVRGGNTFKLINRIKQTPEFLDLIKNKVYAGSSAGMYLVCKYFYENDFDEIGKGLGALKMKGLAHWKDQQDVLERLKTEGEDLPILKLAEGEYEVFKI